MKCTFSSFLLCSYSVSSLPLSSFTQFYTLKALHMSYSTIFSNIFYTFFLTGKILDWQQNPRLKRFSKTGLEFLTRVENIPNDIQRHNLWLLTHIDNVMKIEVKCWIQKPREINCQIWFMNNTLIVKSCRCLALRSNV